MLCNPDLGCVSDKGMYRHGYALFFFIKPYTWTIIASDQCPDMCRTQVSDMNLLGKIKHPGT